MTHKVLYNSTRLIHGPFNILLHVMADTFPKKRSHKKGFASMGFLFLASRIKGNLGHNERSSRELEAPESSAQFLNYGFKNLT